MRLLLVEDEPTQLLMTQRMLRRGGFEVETASDGAAALEKLATGRFQLLVTDWEMPGMDGPTLCRKVRATRLPGYLYILVLTGQISTRSVVIGLEAGADDYVRKPADEAELLARLAAGRRIVQLEQSLRDANAQIQRLSIIDPLVDAYNRRYLNESSCRRSSWRGASRRHWRWRPSSRTSTSSNPSMTSTGTRPAMPCSGTSCDSRAVRSARTWTGSPVTAARSSWWCCRTPTWRGPQKWRSSCVSYAPAVWFARSPARCAIPRVSDRRARERYAFTRRRGGVRAAPGGCRALPQQARRPRPRHRGRLKIAHAIGSNDTPMMATVTSPKLFFTSGMLPNRNPPQTKRLPQAMPPAML